MTTTEPALRRAFVNRTDDNHIDVRIGDALDFVISWRSNEPYVSVYAFAWPMFARCSDVFAWLAANAGASRCEVTAKLVELGYVDDTPSLRGDLSTGTAMTRLEYLRDNQTKVDHLKECERAYEVLPWWRWRARNRAWALYTFALQEARQAIATHDRLWPGH